MVALGFWVELVFTLGTLLVLWPLYVLQLLVCRFTTRKRRIETKTIRSPDTSAGFGLMSTMAQRLMYQQLGSVLLYAVVLVMLATAKSLYVQMQRQVPRIFPWAMWSLVGFNHALSVPLFALTYHATVKQDAVMIMVYWACNLVVFQSFTLTLLVTYWVLFLSLRSRVKLFIKTLEDVEERKKRAAAAAVATAQELVAEVALQKSRAAEAAAATGGTGAGGLLPPPALALLSSATAAGAPHLTLGAVTTPDDGDEDDDNLASPTAAALVQLQDQLDRDAADTRERGDSGHGQGHITSGGGGGGRRASGGYQSLPAPFLGDLNMNGLLVAADSLPLLISPHARGSSDTAPILAHDRPAGGMGVGGAGALNQLNEASPVSMSLSHIVNHPHQIQIQSQQQQQQQQQPQATNNTSRRPLGVNRPGAVAPVTGAGTGGGVVRNSSLTNGLTARHAIGNSNGNGGAGDTNNASPRHPTATVNHTQHRHHQRQQTQTQQGGGGRHVRGPSNGSTLLRAGTVAGGLGGGGGGASTLGGGGGASTLGGPNAGGGPAPSALSAAATAAAALTAAAASARAASAASDARLRDLYRALSKLYKVTVLINFLLLGTVLASFPKLLNYLRSHEPISSVVVQHPGPDAAYPLLNGLIALVNQGSLATILWYGYSAPRASLLPGLCICCFAWPWQWKHGASAALQTQQQRAQREGLTFWAVLRFGPDETLGAGGGGGNGGGGGSRIGGGGGGAGAGGGAAVAGGILAPSRYLERDATQFQSDQRREATITVAPAPRVSNNGQQQQQQQQQQPQQARGSTNGRRGSTNNGRGGIAHHGGGGATVVPLLHLPSSSPPHQPQQLLLEHIDPITTVPAPDAAMATAAATSPPLPLPSPPSAASTPNPANPAGTGPTRTAW